MNTPNPSPAAQSEAELEVCISCLNTNPPGTHFCAHCGTPLSSYAATAPFESIFAEGDFWRKVIGGKRWSRPVRLLAFAFLIIFVLSVFLGLLSW
jgi:hypothetical protein